MRILHKTMASLQCLARADDQRTLHPEIYQQLVGLLFSMRIPVFAMGVVFVVVAGLFAFQWHDASVAGMALSAILVTSWRLRVMAAYRREASELKADGTAAWERKYAVGNYAFALLLGAFNVRVLGYADPLVHMIAVSLVFGFGAGLVSRISVRPFICVTSLACAVIPTLLALIVHAIQVDPDMALGRQLFAVEALVVAAISGLSLGTVRYTYATTVNRLEATQQLALLAKCDVLTGLPNRLMLRERFESGVDRAQPAERQVAVHFLDLDGFKPINDQFGHAVGDAVLREVARRLTGLVRANDTVARLGGDEFMVVQHQVRHAGEAEMLARRIIRGLSAPYAVDGVSANVSVSIGIALSGEEGLDLDHLAECADSALYEAKNRGKGRFAFHAKTSPVAPGAAAVA